MLVVVWREGGGGGRGESRHGGCGTWEGVVMI